MGQPKMPDLATLLQAGIDPKTGLPLKLGKKSQRDCDLKFNARRLFRIIDEQRAVNRYTWFGLPEGLSSQELERLLYFKYSLVFFYFEELGKFFFCPFALNGDIDFYGRYNQVKAVPMTSGSEKEEKTDEYKQRASILSKKTINVVKDVVVFKDRIDRDMLINSGVILRDYTNQLSQSGEPRWLLNDHLLDLEADCLPFLRTNLLLGTGIQGLRVPDADCASEVDAVSRQMYDSALVGNPYVAITAPVEIQELQPNSTMKASEFFLAMQSIDNLLLSTYGIENTGIYEKQAHILESENQVNASNNSLVLMDGLTQRQNFCNIVNSIWDLGIWCELSEQVQNIPFEDDTEYEENEDGAGSGDKKEKGGEE
jgi:hypothetical protein